MSNKIDFHTDDVPCTVIENKKHIYNNAQEQEVNDLVERLKLEQQKYLQQKMLYDLIEDVISEDHLEKKLKNKVKDVILSENLKQTLCIDNTTLTGKESSLLGVGIDNSVLTYSESNSLRDLLKVKLSENVQELAVSHRDWITLIENNRELGPIQINAEDKVLFEYKNKVTIEQEKYVNNLLNLHKLLEEITNTRVVELPGIMKQKVRECELEEKINYLKFILAQNKCKVDIFTETSCSLTAYKELIKDIKEQQMDCQKEIENLMELKEKYKQISGKQYDDILKSYLQYKSSLEKKKILYNTLKS